MKIKINMQKLKNDLFLALIINVLVLILLLLMFYPKYDSDLDIIMQTLLYRGGSGGASTSHLAFSNIAIGLVLSTCMEILPGIPWYTVFHYCMCFLALWMIGFITLRRNKNALGKLVVVFLTVFIGYECYICPGYMKTASILCAASVYGLFDRIEQKTEGKFLPVVTAAAAVMSSLVSFRVFLIAGGLGLAGLIVYYIVRGEKLRWFKKNRTLLLVILVLVTGFKIGDTRMYAAQEEWKLCSLYRGSMEKALGYGSAKYDDRNVDFKYDLSSKKYRILRLGIFNPAGPEVWDMFKDMAYQSRTWGLKEINNYFKNIPISLFKKGMFYCWGVLLCLLSISGSDKKKFVFASSWILLLFSLLIFYMDHALTYDWVYSVIFFPLCIYVLMSVKDIDVNEKIYVGIYMGILCVILYHQFSSEIASKVNIQGSWKAFEDLDAEEYYAIDLTSYLKRFSAFEVYPEKIADIDHLYVVNGVYSAFVGFNKVTALDENSQNIEYQWLYNGRKLKLSETVSGW